MDYDKNRVARCRNAESRISTEDSPTEILVIPTNEELMIAQGAEWAKMLHEGRFPEYVTEHFKECIASFIAVFDSLGSNTVSTEWLTKLEREHPLFPWMNYRIFSKKK